MRVTLFLLLAALFLSGCMTLSSYQTAQVMDKGGSQFVAALTTTIVSAEDEETFFDDANYVLTEFMFRHAPATDFELGAKFWITYPFMGFVFDAKYQIVNNEAFDLALGLGFGRTEIESEVVSNYEEKTRITDWYPSLFMTYTASPSFSITLTPRYYIRRLERETSGTDTESAPGATLTLALGKKVKFMPEAGYYKAKHSSFSHFGIGLGFLF